MNLYQRLILILGAIALIITVWTTPKMVYFNGRYYDYEKYIERFENFDSIERGVATTIDYKVASARIIAVVGSTLIVFFALKGIDRKKKNKSPNNV